MHCVIYKSKRKSDSYLFVENEGDLSRVPHSLLKMLGELEVVMQLELSEQRKLAQADPLTVINQLREQGFYLQMPKKSYLDVG